MLWTCNLYRKCKKLVWKSKLRIPTAYQGNVKVKRVDMEADCSMSEEKDDLKSIMVYKFNNTKEGWHKFALKFRAISDSRGYNDIIEGIETPPDEKENLEIPDADAPEVKKSKKAKQLMRAANKKGYRDLVMSTEGISLNIVENSTSDKLMRGDLKKAWGRLERHWNPKTREDKVEFCTEFLNYKLENVRQRPMDWLAFLERKRTELASTGHIFG